MKFCVHSKVTLTLPLFVESFRSLGVLLSNTPQMIGCTMGAASPCPVAHMFFNMLMSSFFNFGFVSIIEKCIFDAREVVLFFMAFLKCGFTSFLGVNHS
jgi:hypothetical protein